MFGLFGKKAGNEAGVKQGDNDFNDGRRNFLKTGGKAAAGLIVSGGVAEMLTGCAKEEIDPETPVTPPVGNAFTEALKKIGLTTRTDLTGEITQIAGKTIVTIEELPGLPMENGLPTPVLSGKLNVPGGLEIQIKKAYTSGAVNIKGNGNIVIDTLIADDKPMGEYRIEGLGEISVGSIRDERPTPPSPRKDSRDTQLVAEKGGVKIECTNNAKNINISVVSPALRGVVKGEAIGLGATPVFPSASNTDVAGMYVLDVPAHSVLNVNGSFNRVDVTIPQLNNNTDFVLSGRDGAAIGNKCTIGENGHPRPIGEACDLVIKNTKLAVNGQSTGNECRIALHNCDISACDLAWGNGNQMEITTTSSRQQIYLKSIGIARPSSQDGVYLRGPASLSIGNVGKDAVVWAEDSGASIYVKEAASGVDLIKSKSVGEIHLGKAAGFGVRLWNMGGTAEKPGIYCKEQFKASNPENAPYQDTQFAVGSNDNYVKIPAEKIPANAKIPGVEAGIGGPC